MGWAQVEETATRKNKVSEGALRMPSENREPLGLLRGEVLQDDADLMILSALLHHFAQKLNKVSAGMTPGGLAV